jgi:hypothetical protein
MVSGEAVRTASAMAVRRVLVLWETSSTVNLL